MTTTASRKSIQEAFEDFHAANPSVYRELVGLAREAQREGAIKLAIGMLWEVLRWRRKAYLHSDDPSQVEYRLNDHYRSRYARLIMEREADLAGFFEVRALRSHGPNRLYDFAEPARDTEGGGDPDSPEPPDHPAPSLGAEEGTLFDAPAVGPQNAALHDYERSA